MFLLFFSSYSVAPRVLCSFPTRRSSDLPSEVEPAAIGMAGAQDAVEIDDLYRLQALLERRAPPQRLAGEAVQVIRKAARSPDRKSTRLNSSHTVISYAVFCLKKKKTTIN